MKVLEVAVGGPRKVRHGRRSVETCIFKSLVDTPLRAGPEGLAGDRQSDLSVHGGRDKALYAYSDVYSERWREELGMAALEPAQFGQNLLLEGFADEETVIGSTLSIGEVVATVTQPRIPCYKLGIRLGDPHFPRRFWEAGRLGFYLRVEEAGLIAPGASVRLLAVPPHGITVRRLYDTVIGGDAGDAETALEVLADLDAGWIRRLRGRT